MIRYAKDQHLASRGRSPSYFEVFGHRKAVIVDTKRGVSLSRGRTT